MSTRQKRRNRLSGIVVPALCILCTVYFIYHAFQGRHGLLAKAEMAAKTEQLTTELAEFRSIREKLETKVALLRPGTIEKDMLDEQARFFLNLLREDEIVIQTGYRQPSADMQIN